MRLEGEVDGDARMAGGTLRIEPQARVTGDATLAGGSIAMDGSVGGDFSGFGERIVVNGRVDGDVPARRATRSGSDRARAFPGRSAIEAATTSLSSRARR